MSRLSLRCAWMVSLALLSASCADVVSKPRALGAKPASASEIRKAPKGYTVAKQLRYSFSLRNTRNQSLENAQFWTYAPVPHTSHQWVERLTVNQPYSLSRDALGNEILHFSFDRIAPYGTKIVNISVDLRMTDAAASSVKGDLKRFTQPELHIESTTAQVVELAQRLRKPAPLETAQATYNWVSDSIESEAYIAEDRGALYALTERKGDCTEFAYLFTALSRANGTPTRAIGGYAFKGNGVVKAADYHNWAEFYAKGAWQLADPQKHSFMQDAADYVAMRIIAMGEQNALGESHRFTSAGAGLAVRMN